MPNVIFSEQILPHMFLQTITVNKLERQGPIKNNRTPKIEEERESKIEIRIYQIERTVRLDFSL
jgi:hypothetical protein